MATGERSFKQWLMTTGRPHGVLIEGVLNRLDTGFPDQVWLVERRQRVLMIEVKTRERATHGIRYRPAQLPWLRRWAQYGGTGGVLCLTGHDLIEFWEARAEVRWVRRMLDGTERPTFTFQRATFWPVFLAGWGGDNGEA